MSPRFRAVIVDDERLARRELLSMLRDHDCIEVVGEAADASSAVDEIESTQPDVVFLDIEMPGESGFDLLNRIDIDCDVIFTTAFDEYAVRAFEVNAVDYLLKPVNPDKLKRAIERLGARTRVAPPRLNRYRYSDMLLTRSGGRIRSIKISEMVLIQASGDYTEVLTSDGSRLLVHKTMKEWERGLPEDQFCRIHRSIIVNLKYVARFDESPKHSYWVYMKNGSGPLQMSRRCATKLKRKLT